MVSPRFNKTHDITLTDDGIKMYTPSPDAVWGFRTLPEEQPVQSSTSLPIFGEEAPRIDVVYDDPKTTEGMAIANAPSNGPDGILFKAFDMGVAHVSLQYDGLKLTPRSDNQEFNVRYLASSLPTLASMEASQFMELDFMKMKFETDIPAMETGDAARVGFAVHADSMTQSYASIPAALNRTLSYLDWMVKRCADVASPQITLFTGQFKRKTLLNNFKAAANVVSDTYLDDKWFQEANVFNAAPYCKNPKGVFAQYEAIIASHIIPSLKYSIPVPTDVDPSGWQVVFDWDTDPVFQAISVVLRDGSETIEDVYDFQGLINRILELLEPAYIINHARQVAMGTAERNIAYYINELIACVQALNNTVNAFLAYTRPLWAMYDRMEAAGYVIDKVKGCTALDPEVRREQIEPSRFMMTHHIFKALGTSGAITVDRKSMSLGIYSLWDQYDGEAKYDIYEGGLALATSLRHMVIPEGMIDDKSYHKYPVMFLRWKDHDDNLTYHEFFNRQGDTFNTSVTELDYEDLIQHNYLSRLVWNDDPTMSLCVPEVNISSAAADPVIKAWITKVMVDTFGYADIKYVENVMIEDTPTPVLLGHFSDRGSSMALDYRQYNDFAVRSEAFCKSRSPFHDGTNYVSSGFKFE